MERKEMKEVLQRLPKSELHIVPKSMDKYSVDMELTVGNG